MGVLVRQKVKGSGVWYVIVCHRKERKYVKVGARDAAKAVARKIEEGLATGKVNLDPPEPAPTFKKYAEKWFKSHVSVNLKPSTQRSARLILDKCLLPAFGEMPLDAITRDDVKAFAYRMLEDGRVKPKKLPGGKLDKTLSRNSVAGMVRTLSAIFSHAIEDCILTSNPAQRPARFIRKGDQREAIDILTPEEGRHFLDAAKEKHGRFYPLFATALFTGMRQGELLALQWGDVDWTGKFIEVRRANWEGHLSSPKSGKGRRVDLSGSLEGILNEHRKKLTAEALKTGRALANWMFPSLEGTMHDAANLRKVFSSSLKHAGIRQIRFHDLRHTFASWLIGAGESLAYVKDQMGHHSIQITVDTYGHLIPGANRQAVNRLAAKVENAPPARQEEKRGQAESPNPLKRLVGHEGFEPSTC
jgi:integrase